MFKYLLFLCLVQQTFSSDEVVTSTSTFGLIDQLLDQIRQAQESIKRTYDMFNQIPVNLRPYIAECFTTAHNTSRIAYSLNLSRAEITRLPLIRDQLKQATTIEQQLTLMNMTERIVADITLNILQPSVSFVSKIVDCIKNKI